MENRGYIHLYTGNGKGKTTTALGLALRASGAGKRVYIAQFVKGMKYSEVNAIVQHLPNMEIKQYGLDCFINKEPSPEDIDAAQAGLSQSLELICSGRYDVFVLDEICIALYFNLIDIEDVLNLINHKPPHTELILTGRYAPQELVDAAHLVTEMREVKHYYTQGVEARKGIEF